MRKGDNNVTVKLTIMDDDGAVDLTNATDVSITINNGSGTNISKTATVTDALNGKCEFTLTSADLTVVRTYDYQATVNFSNGDVFSSDIKKLTVEDKI